MVLSCIKSTMCAHWKLVGWSAGKAFRFHRYRWCQLYAPSQPLSLAFSSAHLPQALRSCLSETTAQIVCEHVGERCHTHAE